MSVSKAKNPLYVVRNNGVDVESAQNILDLLLKKTGIDKALPVLETLLQVLLSQVETYPIFIEIKKFFDLLMEKIVEVLFYLQQLTQSKKA